MTKQIQVIYKSVDSLIPYINNSRTHTEEQVAQIAASIKEFGWTNPILLDGDNGIIAGHGRLRAAVKLSIAKVPCINLAHLTETQKKAYVIADNKIALNSGWDIQVLALELDALRDADMDLGLLGFSEADLSRMADDQDLAKLNDMVGDADDEDDEPHDGDSEKPDSELFPLSVMLEHEQRDAVFKAIRKAKTEHHLDTSGQAIWVICKEYINE
jgi:ParB-like chromosome segregation protein Spo0J